MNIKAILSAVIPTLVALAVWEMFLRKVVIKSSFEGDYDDDYYDDDED